MSFFVTVALFLGFIPEARFVTEVDERPEVIEVSAWHGHAAYLVIGFNEEKGCWEAPSWRYPLCKGR